uniref:MADF domain-containing protein n=1 Tax=Romanomermis culicivorax TaxID=13658 RepID=A0A915JYD3_ROMCU
MDENAIIEIIIEEVCKRLFLWSKLDKCHSDKIKCRNAWTAIAAKAGLEVYHRVRANRSAGPMGILCVDFF